MKTLLMTVSMCSVLWLAGCATHKSESSVARTLDSYQVGTTTFADFKHDSHLIESERVAPTPPDVSAPRQIVRTYRVPRGSHWRIFSTGDVTNIKNGNVSRKREVTVGTNTRPLYQLTFSDAGMLIDKKPVS